MINHHRFTILIHHLAVTKPLLKCGAACWRGLGWLTHGGRLTFGGSALTLLNKSTRRQDVLLDDVIVRHLERQTKIAQEVSNHSDGTLDERQAGLGLSHLSKYLFRSFEHVLFAVDVKAVLTSLCLHVGAAVLNHVS